MMEWIEMLAVVTSAIYGVLRGVRQGFDAVGLTCLGFAVALGGGTLRDLLLDRHPLFWVTNSKYAAVVLGLAMICAILPRHLARIERLLWIPDALGLGLFGVLGASYAHAAGAPLLVASLLGVVTGTFGGVIADVICNEVPSLFRTAPLCATCAFAGAWVYLLGTDYGGPGAQNAWLIAGATVTVVMRLVAVVYDIHLPTRSL